jgi:hypothetical protein
MLLSLWVNNYYIVNITNTFESGTGSPIFFQERAGPAPSGSSLAPSPNAKKAGTWPALLFEDQDRSDLLDSQGLALETCGGLYTILLTEVGDGCTKVVQLTWSLDPIDREILSWLHLVHLLADGSIEGIHRLYGLDLFDWAYLHFAHMI